MIFLRSLIFYLLLTTITIFSGLFGLPFALLSKRIFMTIPVLWSKTVITLLKVICKVEIDIRDRDLVPSEPIIIASKHQSAIETVIIWNLFSNPTFIMKKELLWVPIFGIYSHFMGMIAIDRAAAISSLKKTVIAAKAVLRQKRSIIIFPEGTRAKIGESPKMRAGIKAIHYAAPEVPVIPVALNSGLFLPKGKFNILPGKLVIQFLPPMPKTDPDNFLPLLHTVINTACNKL